VFPDSPASAAGIEVGDVIIKFDGAEVDKSTDLPSTVANTPVGKQVDVVVLREGKRKKMQVTVAKLEEQVTTEPVKADELGLSVQDMTPEIARELDLDPGATGVVVSSVTPGSPAEEAGLRPGDIIEMVGNKAVANVSEFRKLLAARAEGESVLVLVRRGDQTLFRVIKPPARKE
jgi:serine protease Do